VLWSTVLPSSTVVVRPGSGDVLVGNPHWVTRPDGTSRYPAEEPLIVHADGSVDRIGADVAPVVQ
jgi:hypothetical protein